MLIHYYDIERILDRLDRLGRPYTLRFAANGAVVVL